MSNSDNDAPRPISHVFVDFENVHDIALGIFGSKPIRLTLLMGSRQTRLEVTLVEKLLEYAASVQLVRLTSSGRNALDFTLAYYLGQAVAGDPTGRFHIISKDAGYDALIEHLQSQDIRACRHESFASLLSSGSGTLPSPISPPTSPKSAAAPPTTGPLGAEDRVTQVMAHFRKTSTTRPRNRKKLVGFLVNYLGNKITTTETENLVEVLQSSGHIAINEKGVVTYHLSPK